MAYQTRYGSASPLSEYFGVYDRDGWYIGAAYTINGGKTWMIRGLFPDVMRRFTDSQTAIDVVVESYEASRQRMSLDQYCGSCQGAIVDGDCECTLSAGLSSWGSLAVRVA